MNFLEYIEEGDNKDKETFIIRNSQTKFIPMDGKYPFATKALTHRKAKYQILDQIGKSGDEDLYARVARNLDYYDAILWDTYEAEHLPKKVKLKDMDFSDIPHIKKKDTEQLNLFDGP